MKPEKIGRKIKKNQGVSRKIKLKINKLNKLVEIN